MGLGPAAVKMNLELWKRGFFKNMKSVVEMGAQGLHLTLTDFEELLQMAGLTDYKKEKFCALAEYPNGAGCSSRNFYEILGINEYACLDLDKVYGAIPLDLNRPLEDKALYGKYDLVTDYGTNEHIFNTPEAFRTMHRLCKPGGILMIGQVVYRGNGYYTYDPSFFEGMAAANNYKILFSSYVVATTTPTASGSSNQFHLPLSRELLDALDWTKTAELGIFYAMQKQAEAEFKTPYQTSDFSKFRLNHGYELQLVQGPPSLSCIPVHTLNAIPGSVPGKALLDELYYRAVKIIPFKRCK